MKRDPTKYRVSEASTNPSIPLTHVPSLCLLTSWSVFKTKFWTPTIREKLN